MDKRGRDGGEAREAATGVEVAGFGLGERPGELRVLALSETERQNEQIKAQSSGELALQAFERQDLNQNEKAEVMSEARAIFSQERIEEEVARESKLIVGENVEQAGAETRKLEREWEAADAYDRATEQGKNGHEAQQILLNRNENAAGRAQQVVKNLTSVSADECNLSRIEGAYSSLRRDVMDAFGENLGSRNG